MKQRGPHRAHGLLVKAKLPLLPLNGLEHVSSIFRAQRVDPLRFNLEPAGTPLGTSVFPSTKWVSWLRHSVQS